MKGGLGLKIGMIQLAAIEGDVSGNCTKIRNWVKTYAGQDYDILCFPELVLVDMNLKVQLPWMKWNLWQDWRRNMDRH